MPAYHTNENGSLREFTEDEIADMDIESRGVRDGSSPTHVRVVNASSVEYVFFCDYDQFEAFVCYMLGAVVMYDDSGNNRISRLMPQSPPDLDEFAFVRVQSATGHRFDEDDPGHDAFPSPTYDKMEVVLVAEHVPFDLKTDEETTTEDERYLQTLPSQAEVQYLGLPGGTMRYIRESGVGRPNLVPIPYGIGIPEVTAAVSRKWVRIPFLAWQPGSQLFERVYGVAESGTPPYAASVNKTALLGYQPGTLLFMGVEEELVRDPIGTGFVWNLVLKWMWKDQGHNRFRYQETDPAAAATSGYYFASAPPNSTHYTSATLPDGVAMFNAREHSNLFLVGDEL
jgi:hypothetical protein